MRRITPLVALTLLLVPMACTDDAERPAPNRVTVPLDGLPDALPARSDPATTSLPAITDEVAPAGTSPSSSEATGGAVPDPSPATTAPEPPVRTSFAVEVGGLARDLAPPPTRELVDGTWRLRLAVPEGWADVRTDPARANGATVPSLSAAPDMTRFLDGFGTPGLTAVVVAQESEAALDTYDFHEECVAGGRAAYLAEELEGAYDVWWQCGGTDTDIVTVAVRPPGSSSTVLLLAQLVEPTDAVALDHALATLSLRD